MEDRRRDCVPGDSLQQPKLLITKIRLVVRTLSDLGIGRPMVRFPRRWFTVSEVAEMLGYGETKVRMLIAQGDLRSLKDGRSRRVLPEWVDEYVARRAEESGAVA